MRSRRLTCSGVCPLPVQIAPGSGNLVLKQGLLDAQPDDVLGQLRHLASHETEQAELLDGQRIADGCMSWRVRSSV